MYKRQLPGSDMRTGGTLIQYQETDWRFLKRMASQLGLSLVPVSYTHLRLTNGTYNQNDIDLLNHEYFESKFESFYKTDYRTAHNKTEESGRICH